MPGRGSSRGAARAGSVRRAGGSVQCRRYVRTARSGARDDSAREALAGVTIRDHSFRRERDDSPIAPSTLRARPPTCRVHAATAGRSRPTSHPAARVRTMTAVPEVLVDSLPLAGDVVGEHPCPACGVRVVQLYRAGRARVYCANSCRQRAYRWRRSNGIRQCVERNGPAEVLLNDLNHARRDQRDPASSITDLRARELTACGLFARPLRDMRRTHYDFVPEWDNSCDRCRELIGIGPEGSGIPEVVRAFAPEGPRRTTARVRARRQRRGSASSRRRRPG